MSLSHSKILDVPISVIDFETTGLSAGRDRVVEVAVTRIDGGGEPRLVFDSLVDPERRMGCTQIHGITGKDVEDAPVFSEIAAALTDVLDGTVIASYNIYFDIRFFQDEFSRVGLSRSVPHLCVMYLRPLLGLGPKCPLTRACAEHGIAYSSEHQANADAMAAGQLMALYRPVFGKHRIKRFSDLAEFGSYKFLSSLEGRPFRAADVRPPRAGKRLKSRSGRDRSEQASSDKGLSSATRNLSTRDKLYTYIEAVKCAVADRVIDPVEMKSVAELQRSLGLSIGHLRFVHAAIFHAILGDAIEDHLIDRDEVADLGTLHACLRELGWAPGG